MNPARDPPAARNRLVVAVSGEDHRGPRAGCSGVQVARGRRAHAERNRKRVLWPREACAD